MVKLSTRMKLSQAIYSTFLKLLGRPLRQAGATRSLSNNTLSGSKNLDDYQFK